MDEQTCQDLSSTSAFGLLACAMMDNHRFSWAANVHIFHWGDHLPFVSLSLVSHNGHSRVHLHTKKTSLLRPWRPSLEGWLAESSSTATAQGPRQDAMIAMAAPVAGQSRSCEPMNLAKKMIKDDHKDDSKDDSKVNERWRRANCKSVLDYQTFSLWLFSGHRLCKSDWVEAPGWRKCEKQSARMTLASFFFFMRSSFWNLDWLHLVWVRSELVVLNLDTSKGLQPAWVVSLI